MKIMKHKKIEMFQQKCSMKKQTLKGQFQL